MTNKRKRSDPATLGDLEDFADGLKETLSPFADLITGGGKGKGGKGSPNPPKENDDGDDDDDVDDGEPKRGPLHSVSRSWFGERAG